MGEQRDNALEAGVTSEDPALHALYPFALHSDEAKAHLQQHVLHREIGGHTANKNGLLLSLSFPPGPFGWQEIECARFV